MSVIVPCWNVQPYLRRCIDSLLHQTAAAEHYELIFIDNNSTDGSGELIRSCSAIRSLQESAQGAYAARNRGLQEARGTLLAFTDPDCAVAPDWIARILEAFQDPELGLVLGQRNSGPAGSPNIRRLMAYEGRKTALVTAEASGHACYGHTNNMAMRTALARDIGGFTSIRRGGDTLLVQAVIERHGPSVVRYLPDLCVEHLEVESAGAYVRKTFIYGMSNQALARRSSYRPLTLLERWSTFQATRREEKLTIRASASLLILLMLGGVTYLLGQAITWTAQALAPWQRFGRLARPADWLFSKIVFMVSALMLLADQATASAQLMMLLAIVSLAAFGYGLNEICDQACDRRAGKTNRANGLSRAESAVYLAASALLALVLAFWASPDPVGGLMIGLALLCSWAYSAWPLRFKERGPAGLVMGALPQWCLPTLAIAALEAGGAWQPAALSFGFFGLALGLRWMGIHQLKDTLADRISGVRTFAAMGGPVVAVIAASLLLELVGLALLLSFTWPRSQAALIALLIAVALELRTMPPLQRAALRERLRSYSTAPLATYHFQVLPAVLLLGRLTPGWPPALQALLASGAALGLALLRRPKGGGREASQAGPGALHGAGPSSSPAAPLIAPEADPIDTGLAFLLQRQRSSGELPVLRGLQPDLSDGLAVRILFGTALALPLLRSLSGRPAARKLITAGQAFLASEREPTGLWRYFGRDSLIAADVDDTAYGLMALEGNSDSELDRQALRRILANRDPLGRFLTWFPERPARPPFGNNVDAAVNANVYRLLLSRGQRLPELERYLLETLQSGDFQHGTAYYPSPLFVLFALAGCCNALPDPERQRIAVETLRTLSEAVAPTSLDRALTLLTLERCGQQEQATPAERARLRSELRRSQAADGGWPAVGLFIGTEHVRIWYGSRELTTAFCLAALARADPA